MTAWSVADLGGTPSSRQVIPPESKLFDDVSLERSQDVHSLEDAGPLVPWVTNVDDLAVHGDPDLLSVL